MITPKKIKTALTGCSFHNWIVSGIILFFGISVRAGGNGPLPGFNATQPYLIYYGTWNATKVDFARLNYRLVIMDAHNMSASQVATIQSGPDNIAGTTDDVLVLGYVSLAEDVRPGGPFVGDHQGPRIDPRTADSDPLSSITNSLGLPSPSGTNYASYYLDTKGSPDGMPDQNATFGGYYINAGAPAWWSILKGETIVTDGIAGLDELLTNTVGKGLNCDGLFMDTIDTCAPNSFGATTYEWTTPGMQGLIERISTNYPGKILMANRGLFFFDPHYKQYAYSIRPYINMMMFESYFNDSNNGSGVTPFFPDNKYDLAPKINAEAGRPDGFNVVALDYNQTPPLSQSIVDQSYQESMGIQGWAHYRTDPSLTSAFNVNESIWLSTNADTSPPVWDSTAAQGPTFPPPRVGVQKVVAGNHSATVYWDVARDQTGPVRYNVYFSTGGTVDFATATKEAHVSPEIPANYSYPSGTGPGIYPYCYTVSGLKNGMTYAFAVRAEDSASPAHEDTNTVSITIVAGTNVLSTYKKITVDGAFADWTDIPWAYQGTVDTNVVNFLQVQFANDTNFFYGHVKLASPYALFTDYYSHLFFDTDENPQTGFPIMGNSFGSEMMIETGYGYDQRNGSFNAGAVSGLNWAVSPSISASEFEFRISLAALYPGGTGVFGSNPFRVLLQDNRGTETAVETGIEYAVSPPRLGPLFITQSNSDISIIWTGPGTLQYSASLPPAGWSTVSGATNPYSFTAGSGRQFFRLIQ